MHYELTQHARNAMKERDIRLEWLERTLATPECVLPDPADAAVERRFRVIPEFGDRL